MRDDSLRSMPLRHSARVAPMAVQCTFCGARPNERCVTQPYFRKERYVDLHEARLATAYAATETAVSLIEGREPKWK